MPSFLTDDVGHRNPLTSSDSMRLSMEKLPTYAEAPLQRKENNNHINGIRGSDRVSLNTSIDDRSNGTMNGRASFASSNGYSPDKQPSGDVSTTSSRVDVWEEGLRNSAPSSRLSRSAPEEHGFLSMASSNGHAISPAQSPMANGDGPKIASRLSASPVRDEAITPNGLAERSHLQTPPNQNHGRFSSPPSLSASGQTPIPVSSPSTQSLTAPRLQHRHTLQVPKASTSRNSREYSPSHANTSEDAVLASGRFSPTTAAVRRSSMTLGRRPTRSIHSELYLDEVPQDEDAARWAEAIRQKRASKRKRKEEEDDDRVVVGTKVDQHHVNWVTAYNMLTGIRFTVSRINAKLDRPLVDADFQAKHKFSFDITGNELTPSAKYDFKFKDYAPWVFRHLRAKFMLDPADYLMSLTSKYILSELGSPGKSGSFFYFSRDYKYIIKTIHHAEHKFLRKVLKDYYQHVEKNPNTLLSQFYGLHRVKIPYGRKIHFVVMNNLFPPHRDIHETFDLKGSTIGRDFKEDELAKNPRATLKDLNWLRRNHHLEFGPSKKSMFIEQMEHDVRLLQKLKIMDYSLLIGIHDVDKGNDQNLRESTLQVFQPGGERADDPASSMLMRTPSKLENARKARELRQIIKKEKPIPMDKTLNKMPDQLLEERKHFAFYGDDGGFRATHEDDRPGEEIYYLGIIDCLTHYGFVKKAEHFWKGMSNPESQISPIPPDRYGERFINFITGITKPREEVDREKVTAADPSSSLETQRLSGHQSRPSTDRVMEKAERQARKSERDGSQESERFERTITSVRSPSAERTNGLAGATLPVVEEAGEAGSTSGRSRDNESTRNEHLAADGSAPATDRPPPTPPKDYDSPRPTSSRPVSRNKPLPDTPNEKFLFPFRLLQRQKVADEPGG
ncbi:MAG: hypothetical protein M4579_007419 [Chaenotheca gracillima]|nr:MAG: hypothetical protein M4579_007419 [Chaenotheca gracillima]